MWFKMDTDLITRSKPFMRCNESKYNGDCGFAQRSIILIQALAESANETSWRDAGEMSRMLHRPKKSCEQVWQICIEENVFRPFDDGFNALAWMREKGLIGDTRTESQRNNTNQPSQTYETDRDRLAATTRNIF